ncbi:MAG: hypothetical protein ACR2IT_11190 [Pirellulales bacterium]
MPPDDRTASQASRHRIVAVQGTAQLTSAVAAMRAMDSARGSSPANHLLIHNLACPEEQADEFAECIARLAKRVASWATLRHVTIDDLHALQAGHAVGGDAGARPHLDGFTGTTSVDELLLGHNLLPLNHLLDRAHPEAVRLSYGDGVGLNFSADYFRPLEIDEGWRGFGRRLERVVRHRLRRLQGRPSPAPRRQGKNPAHAVAFDRHYLLLANQFDTRVDDYVQLAPEAFRDLFAAYVPEIDSSISDGEDPLAAVLGRASRVVDLLTSIFSVTKRMALAGEVEACVAAAAGQGGGPGSLLVIKPHPRDSREKIRLIAEQAAASFATVVSLDDPWTFYLPFESVYDRWFLRDERVRAMTRVVCTSSAGLSLEALYGQCVEVGFGEQTSRRLFAPNWRSLRLRHEADLRRIIAGIRAARHTARAA